MAGSGLIRPQLFLLGFQISQPGLVIGDGSLNPNFSYTENEKKKKDEIREEGRIESHGSGGNLRSEEGRKSRELFV